VTELRADGSAAVTPIKHRVTKAGFIGNENPAFLCLLIAVDIANPLKNKDSQKLARLLLYLWHNNNKKRFKLQ
jgi:hypothetical protein